MRPDTWKRRSPPSSAGECTTTPRRCSRSPQLHGSRCTAETWPTRAKQLTLAMRARPTCTYAIPFIAVRLRLQLAKVFWSLTDHATARHLLREIDDIFQHRPALGVLVDQVADFRALISSAEQTEPAGGPPLTPAELRLLPYLQTHLSIREIGERLYISRNTVSSEVGSIYRKLGVSARSDAVEAAMAMGLLGA